MTTAIHTRLLSSIIRTSNSRYKGYCRLFTTTTMARTRSQKRVYNGVVFQGKEGALTISSPGITFQSYENENSNGRKESFFKWGGIEKHLKHKNSSAEKAPATAQPVVKLKLKPQNKRGEGGPTIVFELQDRSKWQSLQDDIEAHLPTLYPGFYCEPVLRPSEAKGYKAAGILLLRHRSAQTTHFEATRSWSNDNSNNKRSVGKTQVLLCAENRKKKRQQEGHNINNDGDPPLTEVNLLGGKIEPNDSQNARQTAAREFWEETGGISPLSECERLVGIAHRGHAEHPSGHQPGGEQNIDNMTTIWCGPGKYALHVLHEDNPQNQQQWDDIPFRYWETIQKGGVFPSGSEAAADHLVWVDWDLMVRECQPGSRSKHKQDAPPITFQVPGCDDAITLKLTYFTTSLFSQKALQDGVETAIRKMGRNVEEVRGSLQNDNVQEASKVLANIRIDDES